MENFRELQLICYGWGKFDATWGFNVDAPAFQPRADPVRQQNFVLVGVSSIFFLWSDSHRFRFLGQTRQEVQEGRFDLNPVSRMQFDDSVIAFSFCTTSQGVDDIAQKHLGFMRLWWRKGFFRTKSLPCAKQSALEVIKGSTVAKIHWGK